LTFSRPPNNSFASAVIIFQHSVSQTKLKPTLPVNPTKITPNFYMLYSMLCASKISIGVLAQKLFFFNVSYSDTAKLAHFVEEGLILNKGISKMGMSKAFWSRKWVRLESQRLPTAISIIISKMLLGTKFDLRYKRSTGIYVIGPNKKSVL